MPTRYHGSPRENIALDAFIKLMRATDRVYLRLQDGLEGTGLTQAQLAVLEAIHFVGPMSQTDLGRKLLRSSSNVTGVVDGLERRGLVARERQTDDRRVVHVALTRDGAALIGRVFPGHARRVADAFAPLDEAEVRELARLCKKLGTALSEPTSAGDPHDES